VNFVADVENIRRKVIFTPKTSINSIEQQRKIGYWRWRVKLNTLKEIADEMITFLVLTFLISAVLAISIIFGSGLSLTFVIFPFMFAISVASTMAALLGIWITYSYIYYVMDRTDKKNES
jgi:hypothetical protein